MITEIKSLHIYTADYVNEMDMDTKIESIYGFRITMILHSKLQINVNSTRNRNRLSNYFKSLLDNLK
jgi:hypothetical protein